MNSPMLTSTSIFVSEIISLIIPNGYSSSLLVIEHSISSGQFLEADTYPNFLNAAVEFTTRMSMLETPSPDGSFVMEKFIFDSILLPVDVFLAETVYSLPISSVGVPEITPVL